MPGPDEAIATLLDDESAFLEDAITQAIGGRLREERHRLGADPPGRGRPVGPVARDDLQDRERPDVAESAHPGPPVAGPRGPGHDVLPRVRGGARRVVRARRRGHRTRSPGHAPRSPLRTPGRRQGRAATCPTVPRHADRAARDLPALPARRRRVPVRPRGLASSTATDDTPTTMDPGDSLMFDGQIPHGPERLDVLPMRGSCPSPSSSNPTSERPTPSATGRKEGRSQRRSPREPMSGGRSSCRRDHQIDTAPRREGMSDLTNSLNVLFTEFYYWVTVVMMFLIHVGFATYEVGVSHGARTCQHVLIKNIMVIPRRDGHVLPVRMVDLLRVHPRAVHQRRRGPRTVRRRASTRGRR